MNNVEINKKYIREHIQQSEQIHFYNYFSQLEDHHHFQTWTPQRTIQVVNKFRALQNQSVSKVKHQQTKGLQGINNVCIDEKSYTSLNLLQEIQQKKAITLNQSNKKSDKKEQNRMKSVKIPQFQFLNHGKPIKFNDDLFESFDKIIKKQTFSEQNTNKPQNQVKQPPASVKKQAKLVKTQREKHSGLKVADKQKGNNIKIDKIFKEKTNQTIVCNKIENQLQCTSIQIKNHEMIHRIFLPDYAMYSMEVKPTNIICKRTYDDFVSLKKILQKLHPCVKVPFLQKGSFLSENDIELINKNKNHLQYFMKGIIQHPLISKLDIVHFFITTIEHKQIKKYLQELQKQSSPKYLSELTNQTGQLQIKLSSEQYELIAQLPKWQSIFEKYFEKYSDLLSNLSSQLQTIDRTYFELQQLSVQMQNILKQLTQHNTEIERQQDFKLFFRQQQMFYQKRYDQTLDQIQKLNSKLIPFIKYQKLNISQFKPQLEQLQRLTERYIRRLQNEPQSPSSTQQIDTFVRKNRFKYDIWQESENMQFFKLQLGFLHTYLLSQTHIFSNRLINNLKQNWNECYGTSNKQGSSEKQRLSIKSWKF